MESYDNYKSARDKAWKILLRHHISSLPVDVFDLCKKSGVLLRTYKEGYTTIQSFGLGRHMKNDGFTAKINGRYIIFYDDTVCPTSRMKFTIAHEIGHIAMRHVSDSATVWNRSEEQAPNRQETQANVFASRLLAPACVLMELNIHTVDELQEVTGLSCLAAKIRLKRLDLLRDRNKFYLSPLERAVRSNFDTYIRKYNYKR